MGDRIRVLHLIKGLGPGGAERLVLSAAQVRDRDRFEYEAAYVLPWKDALVSALGEADVPVHGLAARDVRDVRWVRKLGRLLAEREYDVVHLHSPIVASVARLYLRTMAPSSRPAILSAEHNVWSSHVRSTRALNTVTFPLGDAWIAVSSEVRNSIPARLRDRVEVIVHGVVLEQARAQVAHRDEVRAELGLGPDDVVVGTVANFRRQKAYPDLLAAARMAIDGNPRVRFVCVGQGPLESEIRQLHADLGLGDRLLLLGYREDAVRILAGCDVFALASMYEGYPVAVMEAVAVGLPVVATAVGGIPEAVQHGIDGWLVHPGDTGQLAMRILMLAEDDDLRRRMGTAAATRAAKYDIRNAVSRTEQIYEGLAENKR